MVVIAEGRISNEEEELLPRRFALSKISRGDAETSERRSAAPDSSNPAVCVMNLEKKDKKLGK